jgi:hypothetical protein
MVSLWLWLYRKYYVQCQPTTPVCLVVPDGLQEEEAELYRPSRSMSRALTKQYSLGTAMTQQHSICLGHG